MMCHRTPDAVVPKRRASIATTTRRPHPACLDGEEDGGLVDKERQIDDPIRLVRMVKEILGFRVSRMNLLHHPGKLDGAFKRVLRGSLLAHHLVHHPHEADGVRECQHEKLRPGRSPRTRSGYSLVEMLVVMSVNSALMGVAVVLLAMLVKGDRGGRRHFERARALVELAEQFRADVAAARDATLVADKSGTMLRLTLASDRTIDYFPDGERMRRIEQGDAVGSREAYSLADLTSAKFDVSNDRLATLELVFSDGLSTYRIDALLAKDRRFGDEEGEP